MADYHPRPQQGLQSVSLTQDGDATTSTEAIASLVLLFQMWVSLPMVVLAATVVGTRVTDRGWALALSMLSTSASPLASSA